jgi:hypothetical protein
MKHEKQYVILSEGKPVARVTESELNKLKEELSSQGIEISYQELQTIQ